MPAAAPLARVQDRVFHHLWSRSLVYNACWEDPALDRVALGLAPEHRVLVITSAGCNALDYALAGAGRVDAVDANPRQGALLELKLAGIRALDHHDFFRVFGEGRHPGFRDLYRQRLAPQLSPFARGFWDGRQRWFTGGERGSFYFHGLSGLMARMVRTWIRVCPGLRHSIPELLAVRTLAEQRRIWDEQVEPSLFSRGVNWWLGRQATMNLLGVPREQTAEVARAHEDGVAGFIRAAMRRVFRSLPLWSNYFWTVYLRGAYARDCCPEYLTAAGFAALKAGRADTVRVHTGFLADHLAGVAEGYDRFVLLDHMDWMGNRRPDLLAEEWARILAAARPGARAIWRSAHQQPTYLHAIGLPDGGRLTDRLRFQSELADSLHPFDRVGTYGGFHIADLA